MMPIYTRSISVQNSKYPVAALVEEKKTKSLKERFRSTFLGKAPRNKQELKSVSKIGNIVLFGDYKVGKTSLIHRFSNNYFTSQYNPTESSIAFDVTAHVECAETSKNFNKQKKTKRRPTENKNNPKKPSKASFTISLEFQLLDSLPHVSVSAPVTFRATVSGAQGFILVCSYDIPESLTYIQIIYEDIRRLRQNKQTLAFIVVNKSDIPVETSQKKDFEKELVEFAENCNLQWCSVSALTSEGIQRLTEILINGMKYFNDINEYEENLSDDFFFLEDEKRKCFTSDLKFCQFIF